MADGKEYISCPEELGCIHVSEDVLAVTAAAAALDVEGVGSLAGDLGDSIVEMLAGRKNLSKGVRIAVNEDSVMVDISLLVKTGAILMDVAKAVQEAVFTAVESSSGFTVEAVNVHVVGVVFDQAAAPKQ